MVTKELIDEYRKALPQEMPQEIKNLWHRYFLKKTALMIGFGGIISVVLPLAFSFFFQFLEEASPALYNLANGMGWQSEVYDQLISLLGYLFAMLIPYLIVAKLLKLPSHEIVAANAPLKGTFLPMFFIGLGTIPLFQYFAVFFDSILSLVRLDTPDFVLEAAFSIPDNTFALTLQIILLCVMAPLFEEFAFRGVVLQPLRRYGDSFAIVASALLFGMMHGNTAQTPFAFLMGLVLGYLVVKTDSIWTAVAIHAANNALSTVISVLEERIPKERMVDAITLGIWAICFILGIVGVVLFIWSKQDGRYGVVTNSVQKCGYPRTFRTFITSPTVIISLVINLLTILLLTQMTQDLLSYLQQIAYGYA